MADKTKKQVVSGYHRPVCVKCRIELKPEQNGVGLLDCNEQGEPYELWDTDKWKCPGCGLEVIGGFAVAPVASHFEGLRFINLVKLYKKTGLIRNLTGVKPDAHQQAKNIELNTQEDK